MKTKLPLIALFASINISARAELLVYEGFDYPAGTKLEGAGTDGNGMVGAWSDHGSGGTLDDAASGGGHSIEADDSSLGNIWTGIPSGGLANTGLFCMGERRNDNSGSRAIDPAVTATFLDGTVTWMSVVSGHTNNGAEPDNHHKPNLAIGQGALLDDRAQGADGQAIGGGNRFDSQTPMAAYWDDQDMSGNFEEYRSASIPRIAPQQLMVIKIEWGTDGGTTDTSSVSVFDISTDTGFVAPTEADFDATAMSITSVGNLDQATFDTISFHGSRSSFDEIRLGTEFEDVVSGTEVASGGASQFAITRLERDPATGEVTVTWRSSPEVFYRVEGSFDLIGPWTELGDEVEGVADSDETSFIEEINETSELKFDTQRRFYRVRIP